MDGLLQTLVAHAAQHCGLEVDEVLQSHRRNAHGLRIIECRSMVCYVLRLSGWSTCRIAAVFGYADHGTVIHMTRRTAAKLDADDHGDYTGLYTELSAIALSF